MRNLGIVAMLAISLLGCQNLKTVEKSNTTVPTIKSVQTGIASYYGGRDGFHGRRTASGERFNMYAMTAAHRKLPFGTRVIVTNLQNGRSVTVKINDRGPFIRGRVIDLSRGAAAKIGLISTGHAKVRIQVIR